MDITKPVTMAAMRKVMRLWAIYRVGALPLTPHDIVSVGVDEDWQHTLAAWREALVGDKNAVVSFAKSSSYGWAEDEINAVRALYRSRENLIRMIDQRQEQIEAFVLETRLLKERVDAYLMEDSVNIIPDDIVDLEF